MNCKYYIIKRFTNHVVLLVCLFFTFSPVLSQLLTPELEGNAVHFDSLVQNSPLEIIYLQTNKGIYETGEDLWFKAYILNSQFFAPSPLSKTLYLQIINEDMNVPVW